jgi:hypothetical protein
MKFRIWDKELRKYIEDATEYSGKDGFIVGEYAVRADGTVVFYESTEGGMDTRINKNAVVHLLD